MRGTASTPCPEPGCPELVDGPRGGRCALHRATARRAQARQRRAANDSSMNAYSTQAWRVFRAQYLATHPLCVDCGAEATQPDHCPPRRILLAIGINNPDHTRWLRPRCGSCHSRKTRTIDDALLRRLARGEDPNALASEALMHERG